MGAEVSQLPHFDADLLPGLATAGVLQILAGFHESRGNGIQPGIAPCAVVLQQQTVLMVDDRRDHSRFHTGEQQSPAIPFAVKDLGHTLPGICIGSAVGAALAAFQGIDCYVPHGGFIVALATNNVALFCLDIVIGSVVAAAILIAMKPTLDKQAK